MAGVCPCSHYVWAYHTAGAAVIEVAFTLLILLFNWGRPPCGGSPLQKITSPCRGSPFSIWVGLYCTTLSGTILVTCIPPSFRPSREGNLIRGPGPSSCTSSFFNPLGYSWEPYKPAAKSFPTCGFTLTHFQDGGLPLAVFWACGPPSSSTSGSNN